ncbi:hypothetical protein F5Y04DRAFT_248803 [Hypomontagnella monticulosa]|nr:hypothetical protein F5Y04DRAFT_248803 [Hypomontagnella monticulosa]
MAKRMNLASEPSSSQAQSSPVGHINEARIARRLVQIPTDQRALLGDSSWAQNLRSGPTRSLMNVPPEVLENLKICHSRQTQKTQLDQSISSTSQQVEEATQNEPDSTRSSEAAPSEADAPSGDDDDKSSWASSPEHHKYPPRRASSIESQPPFITQVAPISPPGPTVPPTTARRPIEPFPQSSQEEPLEVQVPAAMNNSIPPFHTSATQGCATPPSAQVVPCTFELSEQSSTKPKSMLKQPIYPPIPPLYRPQKRPTSSHLHVHTPGSGHTEARANAVQSSSSTSYTSLSVIPSTIPGEATYRDAPAWRVNAMPSPSKELQVSPESHKLEETPLSRQTSPEYKPLSPQLRSSPPLPISGVLPSETVQALSASQTPFIRYTLTYPDYNGSIQDFVSACVYIKIQQRKIRTSLYDDFIRAWHQGYVPYVKDCDDTIPPLKVMSAIEWYNNIDDDPLYTERVTTRQNLETTLNSYPKEFRAAQILLGLSSQEIPEVSGTPEAALLAKGCQSSADPVITGGIKLGKESPKVLEVGTSKDGSAMIPQSTSPIPQQEARRTLTLQKSVSEARDEQPAIKRLARSFSEASHHKRKASEDLTSVVPKRLSVNSLVKSDSGSNASVKSESSKGTIRGSVAPSSTGGRKRYANDPEKRSRAFAKFVQRRKKDSIASSTPMNNTPTSAQRE